MTSPADPVQSVTTARGPRSVDRHHRQVQYLVMMSIRLVCFLAAFFTHGWLMWACILGAVVLPYVAVVLANATNFAVGSIEPATPAHGPGQLDRPARHALGSGHGEPVPPRP